MFTDIVGYTALMQQDERKAFEVLKTNLAIHQSAVNEFGGRIIKELGDGILTTFSNVSDAVNAAIKIQKYCQETKSFDLSIGIHQGEVVFENGDIFGDAVNVASRIQSLGIPGSVLFSRKIVDEIRNKSEFRSLSLGHFELKNVNEPIEVFALANDGFSLPVRSRMTGKLRQNLRKRNLNIGMSLVLVLAVGWIGYGRYNNIQHKKEITAIHNGSIAILPFENQTGRIEFNSIGQVAADFISTNLIQNQFWKVIPAQDVFRQTVYAGVLTNPEAQKTITNQSTLDYIVLGHYNLIADSILLVVSVNDLVENKILYTTPVIKCQIDDPMKAVSDAQQFILGFLLFSTEKESATTRPPKYDAYKAYLKGMELWTKNDLGPGNIGIRTGTDIEKQFKSAIALDGDFLPPYFKLTELFTIDRNFGRLDSVLRVLETKQSLFLAGDYLNFNMQKLLIAQDYEGLENFLLAHASSGSSDFRPYYQLAVNALYRMNRPRKALEYISHCDLKEFDFENKPSDQLLYSVQVQALIKLRRFDEVEKLTSSFGFRKVVRPLQVKRWLSLYYANKKEQALKELNDLLVRTRSSANQFPRMSLFRAAQLVGDTAVMRECYNLFTQDVQENEPTLGKTWAKFVLAVMMFRLNDSIPQAEQILHENLPMPRSRRIHQLGILYAAIREEEKADAIIAELFSLENEFNRAIIRYYVAKIETELGHKEKAVEYLRQSVSNGMEYSEDLFEFDADFKNLLDYPPFIALVTPKE